MISIIVAIVLIVALAVGVHLLERAIRRADRMPQTWLDRYRRGSA